MSFAERYPSAARSELRSMLLWPMLGCLFGSGVLLIVGGLNVGSPGGWTAFAGAIGCLAFAVGLYRLQEWARWGAAILSLCAVLLLVVNLASSGLSEHWISTLQKLLVGAYYLGLALYLPSPAATRAFALARSRWVPRARRSAGVTDGANDEASSA